jgi:DNA-binding transcriptional LysR family regulator
MDLSELQVFLTVAREGSFSRAAERLFRTQPAVSLAIRKLEDDLGQRLFVRGARPVRLTDAGTLLKDYAERLINLRDEVKKGLSELEGLHRGELSLGVNESSIHALMPAIARFREEHPGVQIRVHRMFSRDIPHEVLNYRLDLGAVSYVPRDPQLLATEILKDELTLVVPPKHPLAKRKEVDVADLGGESFVAHIVESPFRRRVIELFARHRTVLNMPTEMPTIESIKRFVQMGMGVAIVPRMCVAWEIDHGWMKEVKVRQMNLPRHVYLVSRRGARLPHAATLVGLLLRFANGSEHRQQLQQPRHLHYCHPLRCQRRQCEFLSLIAPVDKKLNERPYAGGIKKRNTAHVHYQTWRCLLAHRLQKSVHSFKNELAIKFYDRWRTVTAFCHMKVQFDGLHKPGRINQALLRTN